MKTFTLTSLFITLSVLKIFSQPVFQKTFGGTGNDEATSIAQTNDSGYVVVGNTRSFGLSVYNVYIVKFEHIF